MRRSISFTQVQEERSCACMRVVVVVYSGGGGGEMKMKSGQLTFLWGLPVRFRKSRGAHDAARHGRALLAAELR